MNRHLTDRIWGLLLKIAFGPLNCNTTDDVAADRTVIPYGSARRALALLGGDMEESGDDSGMTLTLGNPMHANAGIRKLSLRFNPTRRLTGISITWDADGNTFGKLKSWLDRDVRTARCHRVGYDLACHYELENSHIELIGNPFSFGMSREVTLSCFLDSGGKMTALFSNLGKTSGAQSIAA
ncbi:hypothetical protein BerOc1_00510 [Pseudodesulfovibrio hydrargyri]|uniref:Uncharacterized protein n=1 Tax=Pseudodesulfovibrio hydrargyri TaxID=2125990 RepID=A0A1J5N037_9BACT|nr:hypothetical protein [Pseudodesulfovibrio hydrargyri]OIQ52038.1 hypothetical protein BerOc1_00510 [Pseudodesulfovibrio hydrargyri]